MNNLIKFGILGICISFISLNAFTADEPPAKFKKQTFPVETVEVAEVAPAPMAPADPLPPAKAAITDVHGQPLPEEVSLGEAVVLSARTSTHACKPESIKWIILPQERNARKFVTNDGLDVFIPTGTKPCIITAILAVSQGDTVDIAMITVKCGNGAQPPPDPKPKPDPIPPTPIDKQKLRVSLVYDVKRITEETAAVQNSTVFWNNVRLMGHDWIFYDKDTNEKSGKEVIAKMVQKNVSPPALVFENKDSLKTIDVIPLPKTLLDITNNINKYSGGQ